jgi:hypothetical protein
LASIQAVIHGPGLKVRCYEFPVTKAVRELTVLVCYVKEAQKMQGELKNKNWVALIMFGSEV